MDKTAQPASPDALLEARRRALQSEVGRPLQIPQAHASPLTKDRRSYLLDEVQDLYWNDLEWENVTGEEELEGGPLIELTFPGVVAFVRGLLLTEVPADSPVGPAPRPQVVNDFLRFLAQRILELEDNGDDGTRDLRMTSELLDQVLLIYHGISPEDVGPEGPGRDGEGGGLGS
jgi:hypothetical protein